MSRQTATSPPEASTVLNSLLQSELSAVESYERSLGMFEKYPAAAAELKVIRDLHRESVRALQTQIKSLGGTPVESSGPWGKFASVMTRAAKLIGPDTALADLQRGEEQGVSEYRQALEQSLPAEIEDLIEQTLLTRCESNAVNVERIREFLK